MHRTLAPATRIVILTIATLLIVTAFAHARPTWMDGREAGDDPRAILWESKQAAFERLQEQLALPPTATRASQMDYDVTWYDIDIEIDEGPETVAGTVLMRATSLVDGLDEVILDFYDNMTVDSVTHDGTTASYSHNNDLITVTLSPPAGTGVEFEIAVTYHGAPVDDALNFDTHGGGNPIISSLSEPIGARQWWPCKDMPDDKADSARIAVTVDDALVAVSNGMLGSEVDNGATKTYTWFERYPITTYLVSVAISNYSSWVDYYTYARGTMPIENYVYPEDLSDAQEDLNITADAIAALENAFGQYPFIEERYGHAEFPWGGAMEHQTCTSYGAVLIRGDHYYDWILVHELGHMWWGDSVTCGTWEDIWLNEGFASYSEALWFEYQDGEAGYDDYIESYDYYGYFDGPIYDPDSTFNRTVYDKGALFLHMLRRVLALADGTQYHYPIDALESMLATYGSAYAYGSAITPEFQAICEAAYGGDMDWLFLPWIYGENRPDYEYSWIATNQGPPHSLMLHVDQVQSNAGLFTMPIDIEIQTTAGDTLVTVWNDQLSQDFFISVDAQPTGVSFDPGNWILKYVTQVSPTGVDDAVTAVALRAPVNPTRADAEFAYSVPATGHVSLVIYDVTGRIVATLVDGAVTAGAHSASWDGRT
ncbi:MAG: hypothetical protein DRG69_07030, partial [Deltaproteobacteria bacterium]